MAAQVIRNYVNGRWLEPASTALLDVHNPSTGEVIARTPVSAPAEAEQAAAAAAAAFDDWSRTPVERRCEPLMALEASLRGDIEAICRVLVAEMGKSVPDARAELKRTYQNCRVACGMAMHQQGDKLLGAAADIDGEVLRLPVGTFAMIAPFNFPAMVPFWFLPYAIAAGNTFVLKPSERVPCTMQAIAAHIHRCGLPPGVFNLVNGDKTVAGALIDSPRVAGVSFVGTTPVCRQIARRCAELGKRCQALGSAKNHLVVMPDARLDHTVRNMLTSCLGCAGQRCMAASAIVCVGEATYRAVCERFVAAAREAPVGDPLDPRWADDETLVGPVISAASKARIAALVDDGVAEGATLALDGRGVRVPGREGGYFVGPTVLVDVQPGMKVHQTEIFGPVVVILKAASLDEAIAVINGHPYGNGASIYTQDGYAARKFKLEVRAGMIGVNIGIPAPVAWLPFGGMKASFFGDIKAQGRAAIRFFTDEKIITERYWPEA